MLYPWTEEKAESDRKEAEESGLYFTPEKGTGERYSFTATETGALREVLQKAGPARGNAVAGNQMVWRESYTYDLNGNRASKTTPWGTISYEYDEENRLLRKGDVIYTHDRDGNVLSEKGLRYEAEYGYNGQNRMVRSEVISHVEKTHVVSEYAYDALGRRTLTRNVTGETLRTLYDGKGFEVIREGQTFMDESLTTRYASGEAALNGAAQMPSNQATGERYRWVSDGDSTRTRSAEGYTLESGRYTGRGVTLYGNGEAVAVSYSSSGSSRSMYLGKDLMGSVRSVTVDTGSLEDRYEYDAFGTPYKGDLTGGMNLGYTGKPYDAATGLYNYGYRDYKPEAARFTTVDPIRDGNNWFAYVNNDPVNYFDPWGLTATDIQKSLNAVVDNKPVIPLSTLVNTENLAGIITNNSSYLVEPKTINYVNTKGTPGVLNDLNNVNVVLGVDKNLTMTEVSKYGVTLPASTEALTVGNTVLVFNTMPTDSTGRVTDLDNANLLAHESIHSLQTNAAGGVKNFLNEYTNPNNGPYPTQPQEIGPYNFGPYNQDAVNAGSLQNPILERGKGDWFK